MFGGTRIASASVAALAMLTLAACSSFGPFADQPHPLASHEVDATSAVAWDDAANHAGTTQRVCGPLAGTSNSDNVFFLNLGAPYPDPSRFQIVLWDVAPSDPIDVGKTVCATGPIKLYNGVPEIGLYSLDLVEIEQ